MNWLPKTKVLVPVDFSDLSLEAVDEALELVEDPSHLHVVHVLPALTPTEPGVIWNTVDDANREEHASEVLSKRFAGEKYRGLQMHVAFGDPGHEIARFAEEEGVELIVVPSHGRTGLTRLLIGSTAERVVRLAHCPVLVLRNGG